MPIWLHLILRMICSIVCLFGGAILGWLAALSIVLALRSLGAVGGATVTLLAMVLGVPLFVGGGYLGSVAVVFFVDCLPARCPRCRGLTCWTRTDYNFWHSRPISYHCCACGHVKGTGLYEGGGRLG